MQFFEDNPTQPQPTGYITGVIIDINSEVKTTVLVVAGITCGRSEGFICGRGNKSWRRCNLVHDVTWSEKFSRYRMMK